MTERASGDDILEQLVHQFTDAFAFVRELIQNSIDAGSRRVEVALHYRPSAGSGVATVAVADWGEGMNREVIERYLVTKFRSSKEGDLTKIGKFGIGFMSVFSLAPELVVVETGRDGEDWRVLFHPDRSYELRRAPEPLEGTRVILHKRMAPRAFEGLARQTREAVLRWCRHSEVEVTFAAGGSDGTPPGVPERIREPLGIDALVQVEHRDAQTTIVAGLAREDPPFIGFYNRGLMLHESRHELVPGVTFKVVSDLLEHTLTRDAVKRDAGYARVMAMVAKLAGEPLSERLAEALATAAAAREPGPDYPALLEHALLGRLDVADVWFPTFGPRPVDGATLRRVARKSGAVAVAAERSPVVEALVVRHEVVVRDACGGPGLRPHLERVTGQEVVSVDEAYTVALPRHGPAERALAEALRPLLRALAVGAEDAIVGGVHGADAVELYAMVDAAGAATPSARAACSPFARSTPPVLCFNAAHRAVAAATRLASTRPRLAAYLLCRLLALTEGSLRDDRDRALTEALLR